MIFNKIFCVSVLMTCSSIYANNYLSSLPSELVYEICKNLDAKSITSLKKVDKLLYNHVQSYLDFQKNKEHLVLSGNMQEIKDWIKLITNPDLQQNSMTESLVLNLREDSSFYSNINLNHFESNMFYADIAKKLPNLKHVVVNRYSNFDLISFSEIIIGSDSIYLKGNILDIGTLQEFYKFKKLVNIKFVVFDLLKNPTLYNYSISSIYLTTNIAISLANVDSIIVNDLDNYYFSKHKFFQQSDIFNLIINFNRKRRTIKPINQFRVIRNGVEEIYSFK